MDRDLNGVPDLLEDSVLSTPRPFTGIPFAITGTIALSLALTLHTCLAVQQAWVAKYTSGPGSTNPPVGIALDQDGNVYVAGTCTQSNAPYDLEYVVIKYSPLGAQIWANRFGSPGSSETARGMAATTNGDVFITGSRGTVKYRASGSLAWSAPYAGSDIKVDDNGNAFVTGFRTDAYSLVKIAPTGTNLWLRLWDPSAWEDISEKIGVDSAGNVFVAGLATFTCDLSGCYRRPWALKYDPSGTLAWSTLILQGNYSFLSSFKGAICDFEGNLYLAVKLHRFPEGGFYPWANRMLTSTGGYGWAAELNDFSDAHGVMAMALNGEALYYTGIDGRTGSIESHKLTTGGTSLWRARYLPSSGLHYGNAITSDGAGNGYVAGQSAGVGTGNDYATIKYGTNGQQLWVKRYTEAGNSDDQAHAIAVAPNGDVYVTGFSNPSPGTYEITTIKYVQVAPIEKKKQ